MRRLALVVTIATLVACDDKKVRREEVPTTVAEHELAAPAVIQRIYDLVDDSLEGRIPGTPGGRKTTRMIASEFEARGLKPGGDSGSFFQRVGPAQNVVGVVEGALPPDSGYVMIVAHWDNVSRDVPGAVDNAAGVAMLEEIAAAFTRIGAPPPRSIVFLAATGGETGGTGAEFYAEHPTYPLRFAIGAIEIDGINQWGKTSDIGVWSGSDSALVAILAEAVRSQGRVTRSATDTARWCSPQSALASRGVPLLRTTPGIHYLGRDDSFAADREREFLTNDRHRATDVIKQDWDISGGVEDARALFRTAYFMAERLPLPRR
jgi:hypothetical protein